MSQAAAGMPGRDIQLESIAPNRRSLRWKRGEYLYHLGFHEQPAIFNEGDGSTAPTANATDIDAVVARDYYLSLYQATAQTIFPIVHATAGLEIALDQVDNECVEYVPGGNRVTNPLAMTVGTSPNFFIRAKLEVTDASGLDQMVVGWRKQEAFAVPTSILTTGDGDYTDFCGIGFAATVADPNPVNVTSDLNNSGSATVSAVNFTWADGLVHTLEMRVIAGVVECRINGVPLGGTVSLDGDGAAITAQETVPAHAFTFDTGDLLVPWIFLRQDAHVSPVYLSELEVGHLESISDDPAQRGV